MFEQVNDAVSLAFRPACCADEDSNNTLCLLIHLLCPLQWLILATAHSAFLCNTSIDIACSRRLPRTVHNRQSVSQCHDVTNNSALYIYITFSWGVHRCVAQIFTEHEMGV